MIFTAPASTIARASSRRVVRVSRGTAGGGGKVLMRPSVQRGGVRRPQRMVRAVDWGVTGGACGARARVWVRGEG